VTKAPLELLRQHLETMVAAIETCRDRNWVLPSLVLLYAGIDVLGSLEHAPAESASAGFRRWTTQYLVADSVLACTADDLWGARCAILHTYTAESDVVQSGRAKPIFYSWGAAQAAELRDMAEELGRVSVALHVDDLISAFKRGVSRFFFELASDPERLTAVSEQAGLWFTNVDRSVGDNFLRLTGRRPDV
jgi:hypothetical protein